MKDLRTVNAIEFAWIGDAVITQYVRAYLIRTTDYKVNALQRESKRYVSAKAQARILEQLQGSLTPEEELVCKRGRNSHTGHTAKNADVGDYKAATALEALIGWLYLTEQTERLDEILTQMIRTVQGSEDQAGQ